MMKTVEYGNSSAEKLAADSQRLEPTAEPTGGSRRTIVTGRSRESRAQLCPALRIDED
jgi:hypothetical protein